MMSIPFFIFLMVKIAGLWRSGLPGMAACILWVDKSRMKGRLFSPGEGKNCAPYPRQALRPRACLHNLLDNPGWQCYNLHIPVPIFVFYD